MNLIAILGHDKASNINVRLNEYLCKSIIRTKKMADNHTPAQRYRNMAAIHSASTKPELKLRRTLWRLGFRYRVNDKRLPGSPDIVLPKYRTVIFVHGCFWHGHQGCKYYTVPKTNTDFWTDKITRNRERDQEVWRQLEAEGWSVIVVWECQLKNNVMNDTLSSVETEIRRNRESYLSAQEERRKARESYSRQMKSRREREKALREELRRK